MRGLAALFLIHFVAVTFAPGWIVADFLVERNRIERELCVQRMVPDDLRTCHGECQLSKKLRAVDQRSENLPNELKAVHIDEMLPVAERAPMPLTGPETDRVWTGRADKERDGYPERPAHVPWCHGRA